jgi:putative transposase
MPEHVHLLVSEPERGSLRTVLQMLKQTVSRKLARREKRSPSWQAGYYECNVWSDRTRVQKLRYLHRNPVKRGLCERPEDWQWSSFRHYLTGADSGVEIESQWAARKRQAVGSFLRVSRREQA